MLTEIQLLNLAESYAALWEDYEIKVAETIRKSIERLTNVDDARAKFQAAYLEEAQKLREQVRKDTERMIERTSVAPTLSDAANQSIQFDREIYAIAGMKPVELEAMPAAKRLLTAGIQKTNGLIANLTRTTAISAQNIFITACSLAEMQAESGALSLDGAAANAIRQAAKDGNYVLYPSGHKDTIDVAVKRAVRTGITQTTGALSMMNAQEMGADLMEISAHYGARPEHAEWQGRIVSLSGQKGYLNLDDIGYGTGTGFKGWNCRHDWYPYFEGISVRTYTEEQLDRYKDKLLYYDGNYIPYYEATQMLRRIERNIRKLKREAAALNSPLTKSEYDKKIRQLGLHYGTRKDFCKQTGLTSYSNRVRTVY